MWYALACLAGLALVAAAVVRLLFYEIWIRAWTYLFLYLGKTERALRLVRRQLDRVRRSKGDGHIETALTYCTLGQIQYENGLQDEGRGNVARGAAVAAGHPFEQDEQYANRMAIVAEALSAVGEQDQAMVTMQRLIDIHRTRTGITDSQMLSNLGVMLIRAKRPSEAVPLLEEAVAGMEATDDATLLAVARFNLGEAYTDVQRWTEADRLIRQSIETLQESGALELGDALDSLAHLREAQEEWEAAERIRLQALTALQRSLGENHAEVVSQMEKLAALLGRLNRGTERDLYQNKAREIREGLTCMVS